MKKSSNKTSDATLRAKAEKILNDLSTAINPLKTWMSKPDALKLIHELQVHHIELELQNEELILAAEERESTREKFIEFYDFAPTGFFTLSKEGEILELNLCGSQLLGKDRTYLANKQFGFFVSKATKKNFNLFLEKIFRSKARESCEITLQNNDSNPVRAFLTGIALPDGEHCYINLVDISSL
ncbi:MAG: PAS domain-containing protein [Bacteroidetes bacterium]|nr:PAS domain-containing protein [Bacteroidota bacterium]